MNAVLHINFYMMYVREPIASTCQSATSFITIALPQSPVLIVM